MDAQKARRVRGETLRLCHSGLDSNRLGLQAERLLSTVVPFDRSCWHNIDPASSMLTSVIGEAAPTDPLLPVLEYGTADVNHYADLARARVPVSALRMATRGRPAVSRRYREVLQPMQIEDELTASFVIGGTFWGSARLYRSGRWPPFDAVEVAFVAGLAPILAEGFRSALLARSALVGGVTEGPGVVILNEDSNLVESITPAATRWLQEVIDVVPQPGELLPHPLYAIAGRIRAIANGVDTAQIARCRVPMRSGGWLVLHGMRLVIACRECISIIVEPALATELAPLVVSAYGLTKREQEVARHALQGWSTKRIAEALGLSPYTVSDHLRQVFEKVGVHTRTEFASRIFFDYYWPRLAEADRPTPRSSA
jgi:DNA-binding CsgD family transcriptional regulator